MAPITAVKTPAGLLAGNAPGVKMEVEWDPNPAIVAAGYINFGLSFRDFKEPLAKSVQKVISPSIAKNFEVGGRPPWDQLTDVTIAVREYEGYDAGPILVRSGNLKSVASELQIWTVDKDQAFVSDLPGAQYGGVHQTGFMGYGRFSGPRHIGVTRGPAGSRISIGRDIVTTGAIPARPFLLIQDDDVSGIEEVFLQWTVKTLTESGFIAFI